jgi:endo-alpha-1,4-polygalactosaminidase (GH114 family)
LTPVQKAQKAQTLLENEGFDGYNLDVLVDAYASEQTGKSLSLMVMSTKPNEKVNAVSQIGEQIKNDVQNDYRLRR